MKRFLIPQEPGNSAGANESQPSTSKRPRQMSEGGGPTVAEKMKMYKKNLKFNPKWKDKWCWIDYLPNDGMYCSICKRFGKPPPSARGAWVSKPVANWVKATELLRQHERSEWHLAAVEVKALASVAQTSGDIIERMSVISDEERKKNRSLIKILLRSLHYLVINHSPHTTMFDGIIQLQIDNGIEQLESHKQSSPSNATYLSKFSTAEFLKSISFHIEDNILVRFKSSQFYSIMADESTDISSKEELAICGRWLEDGKAVEGFLGLVHVHEVNAEALTKYLLAFLHDKGISLQKIRGLGFDGTNTMSGERSGVQKRMRSLVPSALYIHCHCHKLQLAAVYSANEHNEVKRVLGTLLTMWKCFHYSPKKAEKLAEIEAVLNTPEIKVTKPSDTRWLARERCVRAVRQVLPALVKTLKEIHAESGDAEVYGLSVLLCTYKFVACLYMLCDVLHTVAKLQGGLQSKDLDLSVVPVMVQTTTGRLRELKDNPSSSTWFKDHSLVFSDPAQLGELDIEITEFDKETFIQTVYKPYIQSVIDHITSRMRSSDVFSAYSIFNPRHLPEEEKNLSTYGSEELELLTNYYGKPQTVSFQCTTGTSVPDVNPEQTEAEWKIFRRMMFTKFKNSTAKEVINALVSNTTLGSAFPNLVTLATIVSILPVTTATVERSFSNMKLVKTRLRNQLSDNTLDQAMIESVLRDQKD